MDAVPLAESIDAVAADMVAIEGGCIQLRDDAKQTKWTARVQPFLIGKFQVTQAVYTSVTGQSPFGFKGPQKPAERVSWLEAVAFCNRLSRAAGLSPCYTLTDDSAEIDTQANGYRLPSDAEWEYACRAGSRAAAYGPMGDIAWYAGNSGGTTHDVGGKAPNAWGLYDMLGNVWEWCTDLYDPEVYGPYRIFRGGGWNDSPRGCLAGNRRRSHPTYEVDDLGFRLARSQ